MAYYVMVYTDESGGCPEEGDHGTGPTVEPEEGPFRWRHEARAAAKSSASGQRRPYPRRMYFVVEGHETPRG